MLVILIAGTAEIWLVVCGPTTANVEYIYQVVPHTSDDYHQS